MKNFYQFLHTNSQNLCNQIQTFAIFSLIVHITLFLQEDYSNKNYGSLELRLIAVIISCSWIIYNKIISEYPRIRMVYLYITIIYQLPFLFSYMLVQNQNFIEWYFYLLVANLWLISFFNSLMAIILFILGSYLSYLVIPNLDFSLLMQSTPSLGVILSFTLIYNWYYKQNIAATNKDKNNKLEQIIESKSALINNIIHEIRNPLYGLLTISGILKDNISLPQSQINKQINIIYDTIGYLSKLTNELLDYSKFNAGKMIFTNQKIELIQVIKDIIEHVETLYLSGSSKNLNINFITNNVQIVNILGDEIKIRQLLTNLLINAIKYSDKGTITVEVNQIIWNNSQNYWEIKIVDQGIGIPETELDSIFKPFTRSMKVENVKLGTGLGLAFCKEIVVGHKGLIWAKNNESTTGAVFTIILPVVKKI